MNAILITLSLITAQQAPVLHPAWKFPVNAQWESVSIRGDLMAYGEFEEYGVVDLKVGKVLWRQPLKDKNWSSDVVFVGDTLYIASGNATFKAVEARTGKTIWSLPRKGFSSAIGNDGKRAFAELSMGVLSGIDLKSKKPVWTYNLDRGVTKPDAANPRLIERPAIYDGKLIFNATGGYVAALNPETGVVAWRTPIGARYNFSLSFAGDSVLAWTSGTLTSLDVKTGRFKWKVAIPGKLQGEPAVQDGRVYFVTDRPKAVCVSLDGHNVWTVPMGESQRFGNFDITGVTPTEDGLLIFDGGKLRWLSPEDGHELAHLDTLPTTLSQRPLPYEGDLLLVGGDIMVRLSPNAAPEVFDPKQRAAEMLARMDKLNRAEMLEFSKMGPQAFEVLYQVTLKKLKEYRATKGPAGQKLFSFIYDAGELVRMSATAENTDQLLSLYQAAKGSEAEGMFLTPLMERGREEATIPIAIALIQKGDERSVGMALGKLSESKDPRAVQILARALKDPKANENVRSVAYTYLANNGGPEEVELVRNARRTSRTLSPLAERMGIAGMGTTPTSKGYPELLATKKDAKGVLWGLVRSNVLGSGGDFWIVRRQGNRWVDPVFTGVKQERSYRIPLRKVGQQPQKLQGVPIKDVAKGAWFKLFVGNAKLRVDIDKDGLTDLAEARLGTNPKSADSDGDGLGDATDANPLAPERALSESERILYAAAEARYHDSTDYEQPALLEAPQGMKPFEIRGWGGPVIWTVESPKQHPLRECWEEGAGFMSFAMRPDNDELPPNTPVPDRYIAWSPDHQTAIVTISTYFGGLNGTGYEVSLRKFGDDWLVVGMKMAWIS